MTRSPLPPLHPGHIQFVDEADHTEHVRAYTEVPQGVAFVVVDGESVPVVRVVASLAGDVRTIVSYGADGAVLERAIQRPRR